MILTSALDTIDSIPQSGMFYWDLNADCVQADAAVATLFGFDPAEAESGKRIDCYLDRVAGADRPRIAKAIHEAVVSGEYHQEDYDIVHYDGSVTPISSFGRCFRSADGMAFRFVGVMSRRVAIDNDPLMWHCLEAYDLASRSGRTETARLLGETLLSMADATPSQEACRPFLT